MIFRGALPKTQNMLEMYYEKVNRIDWLDYGRGLCMLCVILFHTWAYYVKDGRVIVDWIEPFYLTLFFFISGYLINIDKFDIKKSLLSTIKRLVVPYLIFSSIIWIPKSISHGNSVDLLSAICDIGGGYANWFVPALICSRLALTLILSINKSFKFIWIGTGFFLVAGLLLLEFVPFNMPWNMVKGFICLLYLTLGLTYRSYENKIKSLSNTTLMLLSILYIFLMYINRYVFPFEKCIYTMSLGNVVLSDAFAYVVVSLLAILVLVNMLKQLPTNIKCLSYIGENSLIFYFLNTGALTVMCIVARKLGLEYKGNIMYPIVIFLIDIALMYIASYLIMKFAPWMVGMSKKLSNHKSC